MCTQGQGERARLSCHPAGTPVANGCLSKWTLVQTYVYIVSQQVDFTSKASLSAPWWRQVDNLESALPVQGILILILVPHPSQRLHILCMRLCNHPASARRRESTSEHHSTRGAKRADKVHEHVWVACCPALEANYG